MSTESRSRWVLPATCVVLGVAFLIASAIGGDPGGGLISLAVMLAVGALFAFGGRFETVRLMRDPDERWSRVDMNATALAGVAIMFALIAAFVVQLAQGEDTTPYSELLALGGVTYIGALAWFRWRG